MLGRRFMVTDFEVVPVMSMAIDADCRIEKSK